MEMKTDNDRINIEELQASTDNENNNIFSSPNTSIEEQIKEFNITFEQYATTKSEISHDKLNKILTILAVSTNSTSFNTDNTDVVTLFINLSHLISTLESRSSLFWSIIGLLEVAVQDSNVKKSLVEKFRFMQTLSKLLITVNNPDRLQMILNLLENLSYGIKITWQEPYLENLIKYLVSLICSKNKCQENLKVTALSILINLCYKNLPSVYVVMRIISPEKLLTHIQYHGILVVKMSFILENNLQEISQEDIYGFIEFTFAEVNKSLNLTNYNLLQHTVDFFQDMKSCDLLLKYFENYPNYNENVQKILININSIKNNKENENCLTQIESLAYLFDFLKNLLQIGTYLHEIISEIVNCVIKWITYQKAGIKSLELLLIILKIDEKIKNLSIRDYYEITENMSHCMNLSGIIDMKPEHITAIIKILIVLIKQRYKYIIPKEIFQNFIFKTVFDQLLPRINDSSTKTPTVHDIEIPMYMSALYLLSLLAENFKEMLWSEKLEEFMKLPIIKLVITKAILHKNPDVCSFVFDLSKHKSFPSSDISKILSREQLVNEAKSITSKSDNENVYDDFLRLNDGLDYNQEKELNDLIDKIRAAYNSDSYENIAVSDITKLFEFKLAVCANTEKNLLSKLDESDVQITNLSHKLSILSAEFSKCQSENFAYQMSIEKFLNENLKLKNENEKLCDSINLMQNKLQKQKYLKNKLIKETEIQQKEINEFQDKLSSYIVKVTEQENQIHQLQAKICYEEKRCKELECQIDALRTINDNFERKIHEKNEFYKESLNEVQELEKAKCVLDQEIDQITNLLTEKDKLLENYSKDLLGMEELKSKIITLIHGQQNFK